MMWISLLPGAVKVYFCFFHQPIGLNKSRYKVNIFLISPRKHMFSWRNKKIINSFGLKKPTLSGACVKMSSNKTAVVFNFFQGQAIVVGFLASLVAMVMGWIPDGVFEFQHALLLCASSMCTASLASFVLGKREHKIKPNTRPEI